MKDSSDFSESCGVFDGFRNNSKQSKEIVEITSKNSRDHTDSGKTANKHSKGNIFTACQGLICLFAYWLKKNVRRDRAIVTLTVAVALAVSLTWYFILTAGAPTVPASNAETSAADAANAYAERLALYDYEALAKTDLIKTEKLIVLVENTDYGSYLENKISEQNEVFGKNTKIKIKKTEVFGMDPADRAILGAFLKKEFGMSLSDKRLDGAKTATVWLKKIGKNSVDLNYTLHLIPTGKADGGWKIINSVYVNNYAQQNHLSVPDSNNFAADGEDFFN